MFFWLFPAVRQYRSQLFWYFFVLAFFEPASYLVYFITGYYQLKIIFALLLLYSVLFSFLKRRIFIYNLPFFFLILIFDRFILTLPGYYYVAASQRVIFFSFSKEQLFLLPTEAG